MNVQSFLFQFEKFKMNCLNSSNLLYNQRLFQNFEINLFLCYFFRSTVFNSDGGIIYCNNFNSNIEINECIFYKCSSEGNGGSIYFNCVTENSNNKIEKTCAFDCNCGINDKTGQFGWIQISKNINCKNIIKDRKSVV